MKTGNIKPNIVFITIDALRADHVGFMGYKKNTTPFLDSLAERGVVFKNAHAAGPGSPQSFSTIFTSTYPADYGGPSYIERPRVLMSEALQSAGYRTFAFHSNAYLSGYFGYDRGWDSFHYLSPFKADGPTKGIRHDSWQARLLRKISGMHKWLRKNLPPLGIIFAAGERLVFTARKLALDVKQYRNTFFTADEMNSAVKRTLPRGAREPIFLWIHYMDVHTPYALFARKGKDRKMKCKYYLSDYISYLIGDLGINKIFSSLYLGLYDESITYVDSQIREMFDYLSSANIIDKNSVLIVSADHGEEFYEHGQFGHQPTLFDINTHVPLIVYAPAHHKPAVIERPVGHIDLAATVADFGGAPRPKTYVGKNFFDEEERPVISQSLSGEGDLTNLEFLCASIIHKGYKLIVSPDKKLLFSLKDHREKENLYDANREIARALEKKIKPYLPRPGDPFFRPGAD